MEAKSLNLVSVQKPSNNANPVLQRRSKFTSSIEQQILKIGSFRDGRRVSRENFFVADGAMLITLKYGKQNVELQKGKSTLKASSWDDLVAQLEQIKTITVAGGLDDALAACAKAVQANFKAAKDKKSAKA